jgi:hypothetical protein
MGKICHFVRPPAYRKWIHGWVLKKATDAPREGVAPHSGDRDACARGARLLDQSETVIVALVPA